MTGKGKSSGISVSSAADSMITGTGGLLVSLSTVISCSCTSYIVRSLVTVLIASPGTKLSFIFINLVYQN